MRKFILGVPMICLSACSFMERPYLGSEPTYTNYSPCQTQMACPHGQGYAVAAPQNTHGHFQSYNENLPPVATYAPVGPGHINPASNIALRPQYAPQRFYGYGQDYYGPQLHHLRGMHTQKSGHFYGTLGAVIQNKELDVFGIEGRIGYNSGQIVGAELEGSIGVVDDNQTVDNPLIGDVEINTGYNYNVAAFALARLPVSEKFSVHARMGYDFRRLNVDGKALDGTEVSQSAKFNGVAYGTGVEYALSPRSGLRFDVTRYRNNSGRNNSISASFTRKF